MKIVLDESVPRRVVTMLHAHELDASAFPAEWKGLKNGTLLAEIEAAGFDCFLTCDRNLRHQQTIAGRKFGMIVLPRQRYPDLIPFETKIVDAVRSIRSGHIIVVEG